MAERLWKQHLSLALLQLVTIANLGFARMEEIPTPTGNFPPTEQDVLKRIEAEQLLFDEVVAAGENPRVSSDSELRALLENSVHHVFITARDPAEIKLMRETIMHYHKEAESPLTIYGQYAFADEVGTTEERFQIAKERAGILAPFIQYFEAQTKDPELYNELRNFFSQKLISENDTLDPIEPDIFKDTLVVANHDDNAHYFPNDENDQYQSGNLRTLMDQKNAFYLADPYHRVEFLDSNNQVAEYDGENITMVYRPHNFHEVPLQLVAGNTNSVHGAVTSSLILRGADPRDPNMRFLYGNNIQQFKYLFPELSQSDFFLMSSQLGIRADDLWDFSKQFEETFPDKGLLFYAVNNAASRVRGGKIRPHVIEKPNVDPSEGEYSSYPTFSDQTALVQETTGKHPTPYVDTASTADYKAAISPILASNGTIHGVWMDERKCTIFNGSSSVTPTTAGWVIRAIQQNKVRRNPQDIISYIKRGGRVETAVMADQIRMIPDYDVTTQQVDLNFMDILLAEMSTEERQAIRDRNATITLQPPKAIESQNVGYYRFFQTTNHVFPWDFELSNERRSEPASFYPQSYAAELGYYEANITYPDTGEVITFNVNEYQLRLYMLASGQSSQRFLGTLEFNSEEVAYYRLMQLAGTSNCTDEGGTDQKAEFPSISFLPYISSP